MNLPVATRYVLAGIVLVAVIATACTWVARSSQPAPITVTAPAGQDLVTTPPTTSSAPPSTGDASLPSDVAAPASVPAGDPQPAIASSGITVHVAGAVKNPTVYTLPTGARLIQAVRAAGGPTSNADIDAVNLAEKLSDGEKIYIPTKAEMKAQQPIVAAAPQNFIGRSSVVPTGPGASQSASEGAGAASRKASKSKSGGRGGNKLTDPSQGTVDINTADDAELQRLPGVGPAMAQRIIAFRATTHFSKPEDLMQVSGVGQKKFAKMQPFVSI